MAEKNKNNLSVIDGAKQPSVREATLSNLQDEILQEIHVATLRWSVNTNTCIWQPEKPDWLPAASLNTIPELLETVHPQDRLYFETVLYDKEQESFEAQLRLRDNGRKIWVHVNGRRDTENSSEVILVFRDASAIKSLQSTLQQQIRRHQEVIRDTKAIAFEINVPQWSVRHIDRSIEALLDYPISDWLRHSTHLKDKVFENDWHLFEELLSDNNEDQERFGFDFRIRNANGELRWLHCAGRKIGGPHAKANTRHQLLRGIFRDVSESHLAIEARNVSEQQLNLLYDQNPSMFFSMDNDGLIMSINRYGAEHLGYRREELIGEHVRALHIPSQRKMIDEHFAACIESPGLVTHWETCLLKKDGSPLWVRVAARAINEQGKMGILVVCEDISEARELSDKLEYQSRFDLLTGLANRASFETSLNKALATSKENNWEHVLCYLDLDQFKIVNDTCGHNAGDQLLLRVGRMLSKYLREDDVLARLGGDEFGVLFFHCSLQDAKRRAEDINRFLSKHRFKWDGSNFRVSASIGAVAITAKSKSAEQLLSIADTACYAAKDAGRNRVFCYEEDDDVEITRRHGEMSWVARLQNALDTDGFEIYCQLIEPLETTTDAGKSLEILLRLTDDEGDLVLPEHFIKAAENYHIATRLDRWVCENIIQFFKDNAESLSELNFICVNLSAQSVSDEEFQKELIDMLDGETELAKRLCFEITETSVIENLSAATDFIKNLRALGCRFALDDFGSGVSSFAYLKNLDVDIVKIDGMFVKHMIGDPIDQALVSSINEIGHAMGKQTIAEYVEDEDTQRCLKQIGVDYAQGFHIHKPEPLDQQMAAAEKT